MSTSEDRNREFSCPSCSAQYVGAESTCAACGADMYVAKLTCTVSPGPGGAVGDVWMLLPREYDIGRHESNNLVMGDHFVSRHHLKLIYMDGAFYAKNHATNRDEGEPEFCRMENEDFLSVGTGRLKLEYLMPEVRLPLSALRTTLEGLYEMQYATSVTDACRELLRGFLPLTELEKGYVFALRRGKAEAQLVELAGLAADGKALPPQDYRISQTLLARVLGRCGEPLIYGESLSNAPASSSIARFRLKSVICVPLQDEMDQTVGILYGDSRSLTTHQLSQFKPALVVLARLLMRRLRELGHAVADSPTE